MKGSQYLYFYRLSYSEGNPYKSVRFVKQFGDTLGERLDNIDMVGGDFHFHVEYVNHIENLAFQDLLVCFWISQHPNGQTN